MKRYLFIILALAAMMLLLAACDLPGSGGDTTTTAAATTTAPATTTAAAATTTAAVTTAAPEEVLDEVREPENFQNVTMEMVGTVDGDSFDYTFLFANGSCLMTDELGEGDPEFYEGEEATSIRAMFVDIALALLAEGDHFTLTNEGYRCNDTITYECDVLGIGRATIASSDNLVTLDADGKLLTLSCHMLQTCEEGTVDVTVTFTFTDYGTTAISTAG